MPNYPAQIDNSTSLPRAVDNLTPVQASVFNPLRDAVISIESVLGVNPNGIYSTVAGRLTTLENLFNGTPIIEITQDIGGTPESPLIVGIQGRPVADTAPTSGQALVWDGIAWVPATIQGGGGSTIFGGDLQGLSGHQTVIGIQGNPVSNTAPITGQVLEYNGTQWAPAAPPTGFSAGGDLSGTSTSQTVTGIHGHSVPSPSGTNTFLEWTGSALTWASGGGGGGGTLIGDVTGPSTNNAITRIQGSFAELEQNQGSLIGQGNVFSTQPNGMITAVPALYEPQDIYFDSADGYLWISSFTNFNTPAPNVNNPYNPYITVINVNNLQVVARITIPHFFRNSFPGIRRIKGDPTTNYIYCVAPPNNTSNLVAIIDKTQFEVVGYLTVSSPTTIVTNPVISGSTLNVVSTAGFPSSGTIYVMTASGTQSIFYTSTTPTSFLGLGTSPNNIFPQSEVTNSTGFGKARDVAPDLTGNIWVTDNNNGNVCQFTSTDIAAAITNYPIPQPPSGFVVNMPSNVAEVVCWDPTTSTIFVGGGNNQNLSQVNPTTGAIIVTNNTYTTSNWNGYHGLVSYQGFIWAGSDSSTVLQIDPTVFSNTSAGYTAISTTTVASGDMYIDPFNQSILVQDQRYGNNPTPQPVITRINAPAGTIASTISLPYTQIASASNGLSLPQSVINVVSTAGFPPSGTLYVNTSAGTQAVTYMYINSATQFGGVLGGAGTMGTGGNVSIGTTGSGHGWLTPAAVNASTLFIGDQNSETGMFIYSNTPGSETFQQFYQPTTLQYAGIVWQNNGLALGNNVSAYPYLPIPQPIRYFNVTGSGFTFTEGVDNNGNLTAELNLTGGGGSGITVENQSGSLGSGFTTLNFTGNAVVASGTSPNATITINPPNWQINSSGGFGFPSTLYYIGGQANFNSSTTTSISPMTLPQAVVSGTPFTFPTNSGIQTAYCETNTGTTSVTLPSLAGSLYTTQLGNGGFGYWCKVVDVSNQAATNNITVSVGGGFQLEDPNSLGTFSSSVVLSKNDCSVTWEFVVGSYWKIVDMVYPTSGGSSGITLENNGSAIAGNPHSTLNYVGQVSAFDNGGGVATVAVSGYDNIRGKRKIQSRANNRTPSTNVGIAYPIAPTSVVDLDVATMGKAWFPSGGGGPIAPNTYLIVIDSATASSPVFILDRTTGATLGQAPYNSGVVSGSGWNRIVYAGGNSLNINALFPQGSDDYCWIGRSSDGWIYQVDLTNGASSSSGIASGYIAPMSNLYYDGGAVLYTDGSGALRSPTLGQLQAPGTLDTNCLYMVDDGQYLWIPQPTSGSIARIGNGSISGWQTPGATVTKFTVPSPYGAGHPTGITYDGRYLWVTLNITTALSVQLLKIDPNQISNGNCGITPDGLRQASDGFSDGIKSVAFSGNNIWTGCPALSPSSFAYQMISNEPDGTFSGGFGGVSGTYSGFPNPDKMVVRGTPNGAWVYVLCANTGGNPLIRIIKDEPFQS